MSVRVSGEDFAGNVYMYFTSTCNKHHGFFFFSITIDDIVYVIDSGFTKVSGFKAEQNLSTLGSQLVAKANARQRRGRAGR